MTSDLPSGYIEFDEYSDAPNSIRHAAFFYVEAKRDPTMLKWAIVVLHNALQGAMICHLSGTAGLGAFKKDSIKAALEWHDTNRKGAGSLYPEEEVASGEVLFMRLTGQADLRERAGGVITATEEEKKAFQRLHAYRNDFSHFSPKTWTIYTEGLSLAFGHVAIIIGKIINAGWAFRHADAELVDEALKCLKKF